VVEEHTSVNDVPLMEIVDGFQHLFDGLRRILFRELALVTDPVEQLSSDGQLSNNVELVLFLVSIFPYRNRGHIPSTRTNPRTARYEDGVASATSPTHRTPSSHYP
jgi:hypothetical protein